MFQALLPFFIRFSTTEKVIAFLRAKECSKALSIVILAEVFGYDTAKAKKEVHFSQTWADTLAPSSFSLRLSFLIVSMFITIVSVPHHPTLSETETTLQTRRHDACGHLYCCTAALRRRISIYLPSFDQASSNESKGYLSSLRVTNAGISIR